VCWAGGFSDYSYEFLHIVESVVDCMSIVLFTTLARHQFR